MFADTDRHFRKLSIRKMQFKVTEIEFDFTDDIGDGDTMDDFLTDDYKREIVDETMSTTQFKTGKLKTCVYCDDNVCLYLLL